MYEKYNFTLIKTGATCFNGLTEAEFEKLIKNKQQISFKKGEVVMKQGALSASVIFILNGVIKIYLEGPNNKSTNMQLCASGSFISLSALFNNRVNLFSAMALSDTDVCIIDTNTLSEIILTNPKFGFDLIKKYSETENYFFELLYNHLYKQMQGKIANTLLYLSQPQFIDENVFDHLTRKDIAEFASITPENTIRVLKSFEQEKIISLRNKNITILDVNKLKHICKIG